MGVSFAPNGLSRWLAARDGRAPAQALAQLRYGRPFGEPANLSQQIIGEGHAGKGSLGFESAMQAVGDIAKLNHP